MFKNNPRDWSAFLAANVRGDVPYKNNAPEGNYTAKARFIINTDGSIQNVVLIEDPGYGTGEELVRVIKLSSGNWTPAITEDGKKVKSMIAQPLTFSVERKRVLKK